MTARMQGKVAFITGAGAGIGFASATMFAAEGARVIAADINEEAGLAATKSIKEQGGDATFVAVDATDEAGVATAFDFADTTYGALHVLFNCAGGSTADDGPVDTLELAVLQKALTLEVQTAVLCARAAIPRIIANGGGSIINMSSFVAFRGTAQVHAYAAGKGAISSLTRAMAGTYAKEKIRVNAIAPGVALSERARRRISEGNFASTLSFSFADYPFAMGVPEDIANLALFLASDESKMITGQTIMADGGLTAY